MSKEPKRNVYVGHRYVPKLMGEWDKTESYEGLSIVTNKGTSYTSKKRVPVGIDILDEEYWVVTGNYNAQIEEYRKDIRDLQSQYIKDLNNLEKDINNSLNIFEESLDTLDTDLNEYILTNDQNISKLETDLDEKVNNLEKSFTSDLNETNKQMNQKTEELEKSKKEKQKGVIHSVDVKKNIDESDNEYIERLFNMLPNNRGTVILDEGIYTLDNQITLDQYQTLQGCGINTIIRSNSPNIIKIKKLDDDKHAYGIKILNLSIEGNNKNTGIHLESSTHIEIKDVYIYETKWGIWGKTAWLALYERVTIRNYNEMGEDGFYIEGGTSNVYNNVWVKNFKKGYTSYSLYTTFNSSACDTFTEYAYYIGQNATLNACGAEDGQLIEGSFVFGGGSRGLTFNSCETMNIKYEGPAGKATIFRLNGSHATINSYRNSGTSTSKDTLDYILLLNSAYVTDNHSNLPEVNNLYTFDDNATASILYSKNKTSYGVYRWNGYTPIYSADTE